MAITSIVKVEALLNIFNDKRGIFPPNEIQLVEC